MKRIITLTLSALLALSLCACAQSAETPVTTNPATQIQTPSQTPSQNQTQPAATTVPATTLPAVPTEEELQTLDSYKYIVSGLYAGYHSSQQLGAWYDQLQAMDLTVIDKWRGTEYASAEIEWDYNTVLSGFLVHENVLLGYVQEESDVLGNSRTYEHTDAVRYDVNGLPVYVDVVLLETKTTGKPFFDDYSPFAVVNGELSFFEDDPLDLMPHSSAPVNYSPTYYLREDGKIEKVEWRSSSGIDYLCKPSYDENGRKISETVLTGQNTFPYEITYLYDEQGRLTEICTESDRSDGYRLSWITYEYDENGRLSFVVEYGDPKTAVLSDEPLLSSFHTYRSNSWLLSYDENGHLSQIRKDYYTAKEDTSWVREASRTHTFTCDENGRILTESGQNAYASQNMAREYLYGDYYLFVPSAQQ